MAIYPSSQFDLFSSMLENVEVESAQDIPLDADNSATFIWTAEQVIRLIQLYEARPVLWNVQYSGYKSCKVKSRAWHAISNKFQLPVDEVKRKLANLLSSYRRERARVDMKVSMGIPYESQLYFYKHFHFMREVYQPKITKTAVASEMQAIKTEFRAYGNYEMYSSEQVSWHYFSVTSTSFFLNVEVGSLH